MKYRKIVLLIILIVSMSLVGCAYRTSSNIKTDPTKVVDPYKKIIISKGPLPDRNFQEISPVEVSIKKATAFHSDPTIEQANEALSEKARAIGADAVINVVYKSGIGFTTWGYIDAKGMGVKFTE